MDHTFLSYNILLKVEKNEVEPENTSTNEVEKAEIWLHNVLQK